MLDILAAATEHAEPEVLGMGPGGWVALAMIVVIAIMLFAGVPKLVAKMLDARIDAIRKQLEEAKRLRAEAEQLRDDYAAKAKASENEIADLRSSAEKEAERIVEQAKADATALIARHQAVAAERIAAAERAAIEELRARAASAAAAAAGELIAAKHDAGADKALVDQAIAGI